MGSITDDVDAAAKWIATALTGSGYKADFSPASLWEIDRFFVEHSQNGEAVPAGLLSERLGTRIFAIGSYVGEVLRQALGGKWLAMTMIRACMGSGLTYGYFIRGGKQVLV